MKKYPEAFVPQSQTKQPGLEYLMEPQPHTHNNYTPGSKLKDKVAIITGGDSGIGKAVAIQFALEGADVVVSYLNEHKDAEKTKSIISEIGRKCKLIPGDLSAEKHCWKIVKECLKTYGQINIVVNNAAEQHVKTSIAEISKAQLEKTFKTNVFPYFYLSKAALKHMKSGSCIINTTSVTAYRGSEHLIDYSATKGAIVSFTRSLAKSLTFKKIRVNAVAPGPIWTPLIPSTFTPSEVAKFGQDTPMGRAGQPEEVAPCYVFLASEDASYMTGQVLHPNGGEIVNG